jgi:predicted nucleic acid-binding protein
VAEPRLKLPAELRNRKHVVIDTNVFIYCFTEDIRFGKTAAFVIQSAELKRFHAVITPVTMAELLVKPLRMNRPDLAEKIRSTVGRFSNIEPVEIDFNMAEMAGALRAKYGLLLPDMFQAAAALTGQKPCMITNDKKLRRVEEIDVFTLDDFVD